MTRQEILKQVKSLESDISLKKKVTEHAQQVAKNEEAELEELLAQERGLIQKLDQDSPFQVGDVVIVKKTVLVGSVFDQNWQDVEGIVSRVLPCLRKDGSVEFEYKVNQIKKDGTVSKRAVRHNWETYPLSQLIKK